MSQNTKTSAKRPVTRIYIDGTNLHRSLKSESKEIDYLKFYHYLNDKYHPESIYMFMGFIEKYKILYDFLTQIGYKLIFKETLQKKSGEIKGNCDAELIVQSLEDHYENSYQQGILVSGDGDYACLIKFWQRKNLKVKVLAPNPKSCSYLLRKMNISLTYLSDPNIFSKIEKAPQ
jgi:uncharacterized LabA/DUF88 family protein